MSELTNRIRNEPRHWRTGLLRPSQSDILALCDEADRLADEVKRLERLLPVEFEPEDDYERDEAEYLRRAGLVK